MSHIFPQSSRPNRTSAYYAERFDTDLVEQIIGLELDSAVRRLSDDRGIIVGRETCEQWKSSIRESLIHMAMEESSIHLFRPDEMEQFLKRTLENLIESDYGDEDTAFVSQTPEDTVLPPFLRFLVSCCRVFHKKPQP